MSYRPYPNANRAARQLARHAAPQLLSKFELQEARRGHVAARGMRAFAEGLRQMPTLRTAQDRTA